jgi:hypothetical protein
MTVINQSYIHEEVKSRLHSDKCQLLFKPGIFNFPYAISKCKINMYTTVLLPVLLQGYLTLREGHRLKTIEIRVLRIIGLFGPKGTK